MAFMDWIGKNIKFITEKELTNMPKKRFNIDEYPGKYVMYCENQEELFKFYDYLHKVGRKWCTGYSYNEQRPTTDFGDRRIRYIYFNNGTYGSYHNATAKPDYIVLNFKDFDWSDSTMKFKVGDKVRVKNGLNGGSFYGGLYFSPFMVCHIGKTGVIKNVNDNGQYRLDLDPMYVWSDAMLELVEEKQFTKANLKPGMVVEYRNGGRRLFMNDTFMGFDGWMPVDDYSNDLVETRCGDYDLDIVKVYTTNAKMLDRAFKDDYLTLIWERKEEEIVKEMSVEEIEKELGYKVKVVNKED